MNPEITGDEENPWKLYQQWMKIDESTRQSWLVAGGTIQSFDKVSNSNFCMLQHFIMQIFFSLALGHFKKLQLKLQRQ
jgi:hypothetical protein